VIVFHLPACGRAIAYQRSTSPCGLMVRDATQAAWLLTVRVQTRAKDDGLIPRRRVSAVSRDSRISKAMSDCPAASGAR